LGPVDESIAHPGAEAALDRALALDPGNSEALATLGLLRQLQGRQEEAREALRQAIAQNPNNAQANTWLGRSYRNSDPARYLEHVRNAYRTDPLDPTTLFHLSNAATFSGYYEEALAAARDRLDLNPGGPMGYWLAGNAHHNSGNLDKALKTYYRAYRAQPEAPGWPVQRELIELKEYELANAWILETKKGAPQSTQIGEAILAFLNGKPEQAVRLRSGPAFTDGDVAWGRMVFGGDFDGPRETYDQFLLEPGQSVPRFDPDRWLEFVDYALALQRTGAPDRARELIDQATALVESQLVAGVLLMPVFELKLRVMLSLLHAMRGDTRQAMAELHRAAEQHGVLSCIWCLRYLPHWDSLRDDPDFEALIVEQEEKLAAIRQRLADDGMLLTPAEVLQLEDFSFDPFLFE